MKLYIWQGIVGWGGDCYVVLAHNEEEAKALLQYEYSQQTVDFIEEYYETVVTEIDKPKVVTHFSYYE